MGEKVEHLRVELAQIKVGRYLRKGESGKIEDVEGYLRAGIAAARGAGRAVDARALEAVRSGKGVDQFSDEEIKRAFARAPKPSGAKKTKADIDAAINLKAPPKFKKGEAVLFRAQASPGGGGSNKWEGGTIAEAHPAGSGPPGARRLYPEYEIKNNYGFRFTIPEDASLVKSPTASTKRNAKEAAAQKARPPIDSRKPEYNKKADEVLQRAAAQAGKPGGGSTKARETAAKEYRKKNPSPTFLGHDANGSEIKVGSPVSVTGGPDKGERGTVVGTAKGGGIRVKVGTGVQAREMLVDPDELRVKSR